MKMGSPRSKVHCVTMAGHTALMHPRQRGERRFSIPSVKLRGRHGPTQALAIAAAIGQLTGLHRRAQSNPKSSQCGPVTISKMLRLSVFVKSNT